MAPVVLLEIEVERVWQLEDSEDEEIIQLGLGIVALDNKSVYELLEVI